MLLLLNEVDQSITTQTPQGFVLFYYCGHESLALKKLSSLWNKKNVPMVGGKIENLLEEIMRNAFL